VLQFEIQLILSSSFQFCDLFFETANQLVIKVVQQAGEWKFVGKFGCSDLNFLNQLEFATEEPAF